MDEIEDPGDLERKIDQASRIASRVNDPTTYQRLAAWIDELKQRLRDRLAARRSREKIRMRAHELWEHRGRSAGRDEEFWLRAESELRRSKRIGAATRAVLGTAAARLRSFVMETKAPTRSSTSPCATSRI
jgi:hypothetical protein